MKKKIEKNFLLYLQYLKIEKKKKERKKYTTNSREI